MILLLAAAGIAYWRSPDGARMNCFMLCGVLLAQTRYESVLYVFAVALVILLVWVREREIRLTWTSVCVPLLMVYIPLQNRILKDYPALWQYSEDLGQAFSPSLVPQNLGHAANYFFALNPAQPNSLLLTAFACFAGVIFFAGLLYRLLKNKNAGRSCLNGYHMVVGAVGFVAVINFCLLMCYHWGQIDDIAATRIVLPFILFQVGFVVFVAGALGKRVMMTATILSVAFCLFYTRPLCAQTNFLRAADKTRTCEWAAIRAQKYAWQGPLFLLQEHLAVIIEKVSAYPLSKSFDRKRQLDLHQRLGTFGEVYLIYTLKRRSDGQWIAELPVDDHFIYEVIEDDKLSERMRIRLCRVESVKLAGVKPLPLTPPEGMGLDPLEYYAETLP